MGKQPEKGPGVWPFVFEKLRFWCRNFLRLKRHTQNCKNIWKRYNK